MISCKYITSKIQRKYSISHNEYRTYNHSLYLVTLSSLPTIMKTNAFIIKNKHYCWLTMNDMLNDKNIKEKSYNEETFISMDDFQFDEPQRILRESGNRDISVKEIINNIIKGKVISILGEIVKSIYYKTFGNNSYLFNLIWQLFLTIIISCFFTNFTKVFSKDDVSETGFFICYLVSVTFMFGLFSELCNIAVDFVELLLKFMYGIVPTYFLSVAITGQVSASPKSFP